MIAIAAASLRRIGRDRTALFFMIVLPVVVILIVGASERGFATFRVGVVDLGAGVAGHRLTAALDHDSQLAVTTFAGEDALRRAVARSEMDVGVVLPAGMDGAERGSGQVTVAVYAEQVNTTQQAALTAVRSVVAVQGGELQAARFASAQSGASVGSGLSRAAALAPRVAQVTVQPALADASRNVLPEGFSYSAPTQLVLFVFINALAGGAAIIETRRLGMFERMSAAPVRPGTIIAGTALTYGALTLVQSALIVLVGAVAFGVSWGNPLAAGALVVMWALVGTGAGMLSGTVFRTAEQATAVGSVTGIGLGMLGGCMWPLSIVSSAMRVVGHLTPQAWAVDAWTSLLARGGNLASIAGQLAILAAFAVAFVVLASARLRRELV